MKHNVVAPSVGESITEVSILKWAKQNGQAVKSGELLLEIESDKATVEIVAEASGVLTQLKPQGERIPIGEIIGVIDTDGKASASAAPAASAPKAAAPVASGATAAGAPTMGPAPRKMVAERGLDPSQIPGTGKDGRVTKGDVIGYQPGAPAAQQAPAARPAPAAPAYVDRPGDKRVPMSNLRARIAERLVAAQHTAAILTTFNEVDMSAVMKLRGEHKDKFKAKHGVGLGFMSFFTRACVEAFKVVPEVNASIDGRNIIYRDYADVGVAVGTERGLVVPVLRDTHKMGFADIEKKIVELATKAKDGKLSIADMSGGTFTISNGGVYGSMMSTPILTPPQSGILGMHNIVERPVVVDKQIVIRPMMYLALSYDHRLIDGKGAVTFLVTLRDLLEHPEKLKLEY